MLSLFIMIDREVYVIGTIFMLYTLYKEYIIARKLIGFYCYYTCLYYKVNLSSMFIGLIKDIYLSSNIIQTNWESSSETMCKFKFTVIRSSKYVVYLICLDNTNIFINLLPSMGLHIQYSKYIYNFANKTSISRTYIIIINLESRTPPNKDRTNKNHATERTITNLLRGSSRAPRVSQNEP